MIEKGYQAAHSVASYGSGSGRFSAGEQVEGRMSGETARSGSVKTAITQKLAQAPHTGHGGFEQALAYANETKENPTQAEPFGFGDLVDMVNPLQHVPLVNMVYREITGDEIKPISQIVGGAVFGGAPGAAGGLMNLIVEHETGNDIAGNVMNAVKKRRTAGTIPGETVTQKTVADHPEKRLAAVMGAENVDAAETQLEAHAFAPQSSWTAVDYDVDANEKAAGRNAAEKDGGQTVVTGIGKKQIVQQKHLADDRMAGSMVQVENVVEAPNPDREPLTKLNLSRSNIYSFSDDWE